MNKLIIKIRFLIAIFCLTQILKAQNKDNYNLLWKIESKNSSSPSYLFGTMHVDDSRAFNFSDATLPAIQSVDYFALEVDPDYLITGILNQKYDISADEYFKKLLSTKDYKRLNKRFKDVNNMSLKDSKIMNPSSVLNLLLPDEDKEDDKSTFVDMYLLGHARTMSKKIVGLENAEDFLNEFDNLSKEEKIKEVLSMMEANLDSMRIVKEEMTKIYQTGSLAKIEAFINKYNFEYDNMTSRNNVMANSIESYMQKGTVFSAIGAAHLVGKDNVIALLRKKGFKISPVKAEFTGVADTFKIDTSKGLWYTHEDDSLAYSVQIPNAPNINEKFGKLTVHGYSDINTKTNYMYMGLGVEYEIPPEKIDAFMENMITNLIAKRQGSVIAKTKLGIENQDGFYVTSTLPNDMIMKAKFILKNNHFYYFSAETTKEQIEENYIDRFFTSVNIKGVDIKKKSIGWREFISKEGAFSIEIPTSAKDMSREAENPYDTNGEKFYLNLFLSTDAINKNNYLFRYNDQPLGYYIQDLEEAFEGTKASLTQKSTLVSEPKVIFLDGFEGREYELKLNDKYHSIVRVYLRGNRIYLLLKQKLSLTEKVSSNDPFFNNFRFLSYDEPSLETYTSPNKELNIKLFEKVLETLESREMDDTYLKDSYYYTSVNPNSGGLYQFSYSNLKPYVKIKSHKAFLKELQEAELTQTDSVLNERFILKEKDSVFEYLVSNNTKTKNIHQTLSRVWLSDNRLLIVKSIVNKDESKSDTFQNIYNSIQLKPSNDRPLDLFSSKAKKIIEDLKSTDSTTYHNALKTFIYYKFDKEELPIIDKALYSNFDDTIKLKLIQEYEYINDSTSIKTLEAFYNEGTTSDNLKTKVITIIPKITSSKSIDTYRNLVFKNPPKSTESYNYSILQPLRDSLDIAFKDYNKLVGLLKYSHYRDDVVSLSTRLYNSDLNAKDLVKNSEIKITKYLQEDYTKLKAELSDETDSRDYTFYNTVLAYLVHFKATNSQSKAVDEFSLQIINDTEIKDKWLKLQAILLRLNNNFDVSETILNQYLKDLYYRFEIMEMFYNKDKFKNLIKSYTKEKAFAELSFFNYIAADYNAPSSVELLKKISKDKNNFYAVKFTYHSDDIENIESYIGVVGPIKNISQNNELTLFESHSNWENYNENWENHVDTLISDFLKNKD